MLNNTKSIFAGKNAKNDRHFDCASPKADRRSRDSMKKHGIPTRFEENKLRRVLMKNAGLIEMLIYINQTVIFENKTLSTFSTEFSTGQKRGYIRQKVKKVKLWKLMY